MHPTEIFGDGGLNNPYALPESVSPIRRRTEVLQQGGMHDLGPSRNRIMRMSPLRRKLEEARRMLRQAIMPDPSVNMPISGR
jgi:hypothetical protein